VMPGRAADVPSAPARRTNPESRLRTLIAIVTVLGTAAFLVSILVAPPVNDTGFLVVLGLVVLTEVFGTNLYLDGRLSISFVGIIIAALAFGPGESVIVASAIAFTCYLAGDRDAKKLSFN